MALNPLSKTRTISLSLIIAITALSFFLNLKTGIENATFDQLQQNTSLNEIRILPNIENSGTLSFLTSKKNQFSQETIDQIQKISNIESVYPETQLDSFASVEGSVFGISLVTDAMIYGVPYEFIKDEIDNPEIWNQKEEPYPALIPRKILDLYNIGVSAPRGLPIISEDALIGKELKLFPNYSTLFGSEATNNHIKLKVVGFSDKTSLLGVTISDHVLKTINKNSTPPILQLLITVKDESQITKTAQSIEELGFETQYLQKTLQSIESKLNYLYLAVSIISATILLLSAAVISSRFTNQTLKEQKSIAILRALGATKKQIRNIILKQALLTGTISTTIALISSTILSLYLNIHISNTLSTTSIKVDSLLQTTISNILISLTFGIALTIFSAYIPALKASKNDPLDYLK